LLKLGLQGSKQQVHASTNSAKSYERVVIVGLVISLMIVSSICSHLHLGVIENSIGEDGIDDAFQRALHVMEDNEGKLALGGTSEYHFIKNLGQWEDPNILFRLQVPDYRVSFMHDAILITLTDEPSYLDSPESSSLGIGDRPSSFSLGAEMGMTIGSLDVYMTFLKATNTVAVGGNELDWRMNYFLGGDESSWHTDVLVYDDLKIASLYDGIDAIFKVEGERLKSEFIVHPGADPEDIQVRVQGHERMSLTRTGALSIITSMGELLDDRLEVFYSDDVNSRVSSAFKLLGEDSYGFSVETYDANRALVIDPLLYSTYLGSRDFDECNGIAIDEEGAIYVTGYSRSSFPTTDNAVKPKNYLHGNIFVTKLNPDGTDLEYGAVIGGSNDDIGYGIAVDGRGAAYVTGFTYSDDFPTTPGAYQTSHPESKDGFVLKLNPYGNQLEYSTCIGSPGPLYGASEYGVAIDVDEGGNAYVLGKTGSPNFTTTNGVFQRELNGNEDAFILKINREGTSLHYSTFLGGSDRDLLSDIHVDALGAVYVVGASSDDFPTTQSSFQPSMAGTDSWSAIIAKMNPSGTNLIYSSFLGGTDMDTAYAVEVDDEGCAYITGYTESTDFPTTPGVHQRDLRGDLSAFVTKMSADGSELEFSTLLEGGGTHSGRGIAVDAGGYVYVAGVSLYDPSTDYDEVIGPIGERCVYVAQLDPLGSELLYHAALAGRFSPNLEAGDNLVIDDVSNVFISGRAGADDFPVTEGVFQEEGAGKSDVFVFKLAVDSFPPIVDLGVDRTVLQGNEVTLDTSLCSDNVGITNYTWSYMYNGSLRVGYGPEYTIILDIPGMYVVTLNLTDAIGNWATDEVNVTVLDTQPPSAVPGKDLTINQRMPAMLDGSGSMDNHEVVNWTWRFEYNGSEVVRYGEKMVFYMNLAGVYFVSLTVRDTSGNEDTNTVWVNVLDIDPPVADAGPDQEVQQGTVVQFNGTGSQDNTGISDWTWTFEHGEEDQELKGPEPSFEFTENGQYEVTLTITGNEGYVRKDTVKVIVYPKDDGKGTDEESPTITSAMAILALCLVWVAILVARRKT